MSYARWGSEGSDVYVYQHVGGGIECCGCLLMPMDGLSQWGAFTRLSFRAQTAGEMYAHLGQHRDAGHKVPSSCFEDILIDHPDPDAPIKEMEW